MRPRHSVRSAASLAARILALTVVLLLVATVGSRFVPATEGTTPVDGSFALLLLGIFFLQTVAIAYPVVRSRWSGWRLVATAFLIYFAPVTLLSQLETLVYLGEQLSREMQRGIWLMGAFDAAVFAPVAVWVLGGFRRRRSQVEAAPEATSPFAAGRWLARVGLLAVVFVALYYLFGYYVAWQVPAVREYYGGSDPGSFLAQLRSVVAATPWMLPFQLLRAVLWVLVAVPVVRMMKGVWWESGLALALLFSMPSLYLLLPNPLMPAEVARAHLAETLPYQFLFGWMAAWVLRTPTGADAAQAAPARA